MLDFLSCLFLQIFNKIDEAIAFSQELSSNLLHPIGYGGREHEGLHVLRPSCFNGAHNGLNVFLETHVEHSISFIEYRIFQQAEVEILTLDVILDTTSCAYENVDSSS